jgi:hypothetical protein
MKPRKPHKRSLKATVVTLLATYKGGLNAYEMAHLIEIDYPHVIGSVAAIRRTLTELIKEGKAAIIGKECCPTCYASQTFYRLKRGKIIEGLHSAIAYAKGDKKKGRLTKLSID